MRKIKTLRGTPWFPCEQGVKKLVKSQRDRFPDCDEIPLYFSMIELIDESIHYHVSLHSPVAENGLIIFSDYRRTTYSASVYFTLSSILMIDCDEVFFEFEVEK